jgi:hypothetical protein
LDTIERNTTSPSLLELIKGGKRSISSNSVDLLKDENEYIYNIKNLNGEKMLVAQELSRYIDKSDFSVDVRLEEVYIRKRVQRNENIEGLPGVLQRVSREKNIDQLIDSRTQVYITLNKLKVEENTAFFKRLISNNLSLNSSSDLIQIDYVKFPEFGIGLKNDDPNSNVQNLVPTSEYIQPDDTEEDDTTALLEIASRTAEDSEISTNKNLWLILIAAILLLVLMFLLFLRSKRRQARLAKSESEENGTMLDLEKTLSNNKLKKMASEAFDTTSPNLKRSEFKKLLLFTLFLFKHSITLMRCIFVFLKTLALTLIFI